MQSVVITACSGGGRYRVCRLLGSASERLAQIFSRLARQQRRVLHHFLQQSHLLLLLRLHTRDCITNWQHVTQRPLDTDLIRCCSTGTERPHRCCPLQITLSIITASKHAWASLNIPIQKCPFQSGDLDSHRIRGSLGPAKSTPQNGISIGSAVFDFEHGTSRNNPHLASVRRCGLKLRVLVSYLFYPRDAMLARY